MSYVRQDAPDVFVSYAHGPVPLGPLAGGRIDPLGKWTRTLVANVSEQVDFYLGVKDPARRAEFWMDPEFEGNLPLTGILRARAEQSALMLLVMSPFYLQSAWCGQDVEWFIAGKPGRTSDGELFLVRVVPTNENAWPATLRDEKGAALPGYRFHPAMRPGEMCEPLGWPEPTAEDSEYMDLVGVLARDIARRLTRLRWSVEHPSTNPAPVTPERVTPPTPPPARTSIGLAPPDIFVSYAREDHARVAMIVGRLAAEGWTVFWDKNIPPGRSWESYIGKALQSARCVVVIWSASSVESDYVKEEADEAKDRGCYVPISIDGTRPPFGYRRIQAADFSSWIDRQDGSAIELFLQEVRSKTLD